jgi:hypothetical protein
VSYGTGRPSRLPARAAVRHRSTVRAQRSTVRSGNAFQHSQGVRAKTGLPQFGINPGTKRLIRDKTDDFTRISPTRLAYNRRAVEDCGLFPAARTDQERFALTESRRITTKRSQGS